MRRTRMSAISLLTHLVAIFLHSRKTRESRRCQATLRFETSPTSNRPYIINDNAGFARNTFVNVTIGSLTWHAFVTAIRLEAVRHKFDVPFPTVGNINSKMLDCPGVVTVQSGVAKQGPTVWKESTMQQRMMRDKDYRRGHGPTSLQITAN